jgi:hypothetical protein
VPSRPRPDQRLLQPGGGLYAGFAFKPEDAKVLIVTPDQVFAEYMTHARAAGTGRSIHHLFAGRLVAEGGQIKLLRESMNVVAAVQALAPKGAARLPAPAAEPRMKPEFPGPPDPASGASSSVRRPTLRMDHFFGSRPLSVSRSPPPH